MLLELGICTLTVVFSAVMGCPPAGVASSNRLMKQVFSRLPDGKCVSDSARAGSCLSNPVSVAALGIS